MKLVSFCSVLMLGLLSTGSMQAALSPAETAARDGRADEAIGLLKASNDPKSQALLCTVYRTLEKYDEAIHACEAAVQTAPNNSEFQLDLARAYGAKAEHSGALTGMRLVGKIRGAFEKSVELAPNDVDALSDLGEFYVHAPGMVGGGTDKARATAARLMPLSQARGHRLLLQAAIKDGDWTTAESEMQKELGLGRTAEALVDAATYYEARKDWTNMSKYASAALAADSKHAGDSVDAANLLVKHGRNFDAAEQAYRSVLASSYKSKSSPAFQVHTYLGQLLQKRGDAAGAKAEFEAALALAHDYSPARKGLGQ